MKPLPSLVALRGEAHALRDQARAAGKNLKQQPALDIVAQRYGCPNWDVLKAELNRKPLLPPPSPFLRDLQRGYVEARWMSDLKLQVSCFWMPSGGRLGRPDALLSEETARDLANKFPDKFVFLDDVLLVTNRPDSFAGLVGYGPGHSMPQVTQFEGAALTLYSVADGDWGPVQARGSAALLLEKMARDYVERYPGAAAVHPEYFPTGIASEAS